MGVCGTNLHEAWDVWAIQEGWQGLLSLMEELKFKLGLEMGGRFLKGVRGSSWEMRERGVPAREPRVLHSETRIIGPVGTCVCFDREGNVEQKEQILRSLRPKSPYSCLSPQATKYSCLKQKSLPKKCALEGCVGRLKSSQGVFGVFLFCFVFEISYILGQTFLFDFFYWRITALQYYIGFYHTSTWISHRCTYVPSLLNPTPNSLPLPGLWVVTEHWVALPVSHSKCPLSVSLSYGSAYVLILFSQFAPPLALPTMPTSPFSVSASPLLPANRFIDTIF